MQHLISSLRSLMESLTLCPLLYAVGAAATTAGVYYYLKKRGYGKRSADHGHTLIEDFASVSDTQPDSAVLEDFFSEAEEKTLKDKMASALMECLSLKDRVRMLEKLYSEAQKDWEINTKELEQECEANGILKSEFNQMKETIQSEESVKVTLAESKLKYEKATMTSNELMKKIFSLKSESDLLQDILEEQEEELPRVNRRSDKLLKEKSVLKSHYADVKESLQHNEKKLQNMEVTLTEAKRKYKLKVLSSAQLRKENSKLTSESDHLQDILQDYQKSLQLEHDNITMECESEENAVP